MFCKEIIRRESGALRPSLFTHSVRSRRISSIALSNRKEIVTPHRAAVNSLQVDPTETRYLLSGAADGSAAVYDVQYTSDDEAGGLIAKHKCLFVVDKQVGRGHKFSISSVTWYPVDTGVFITGSYDHYVKVWDTNTTEVVLDFKMPGKVNGIGMSLVATAHMLIAVGTADVQVRLCDISSGAFTHTLSGHRDGIMAIEWSTTSEWILMTGGCDGAIRFWDIRRAGCFAVLDQSQSQLGRRPPLLQRSLGKTSTKTRPPEERNPKVTHKSTKPPRVYRTEASSGQRLHPGMSSSQNRGTAHYGAVTGLRATEDGLYLLSSGSDSRLRLWDIESGCNTLVNYEAMHLQTGKALQLAITDDSSLVFVPCMASVKVFDMWEGTIVQTLRGHYEFVNCCYYSSRDQELYTGSSDRQVLVWSPPCSVADGLEEISKKGRICQLDQDCWSD